jgi:hypothetical protein
MGSRLLSWEKFVNIITAIVERNLARITTEELFRYRHYSKFGAPPK